MIDTTGFILNLYLTIKRTIQMHSLQNYFEYKHQHQTYKVTIKGDIKFEISSLTSVFLIPWMDLMQSQKSIYSFSRG